MIPIFARSLQILLALTTLAGGSPVADQSNCPFGCLQVLDAERSRPVEEYAVSIVDESDPFPDVFELPVGFPQPPRGSVVSTEIVRSPDGAHEFSAPVDPQLRINVFSAGYRTRSVPAPRPGERIVVRLSRAFLLSGRVETTAGRPVVGASVHLHRSELVAEPRRPPMAMTDAHGHFQITPLYEKEVVLELRHPAYQHFQDRVELRDPPVRQTFLLRALEEHAGTRPSQPEPEIATTPPSREEAPTAIDVDSHAKVAPAAIYATSLPVAEPESTLSDLDRRILREVLRDVRRRVHGVFDEMDDPEPWKLLVLARTEPFDWIEKSGWDFGERGFNAEDLLLTYEMKRSGEPVAIDRLIREEGLEPVELADLPLERGASILPIAIDFVDHERHLEELGQLPVLISTTLPAMSDAGTEAIVYVRSSVFDFFQWIYHVEITGGQPRINWVVEPVPSC